MVNLWCHYLYIIKHAFGDESQMTCRYERIPSLVNLWWLIINKPFFDDESRIVYYYCYL